MIERVAIHLGVGVSDVIDREPFCGWQHKRESNEDRTSSISFIGHGIEMNCDRDGFVTSIFVHASGDAATHWDIPLSLSRSEVRDRFGKPSACGDGLTHSALGEFGPYDRFDYPDFSAHYEFHADKDLVKVLTLMVPHVVPGAKSSASETTEAEDTVLVIIPSLVAQLLHAEREKSTPLTEEEVLRIRDESECIAMRPDDLPAIIERRGYEDIEPENCWEQWQKARLELGGDS